MAPGASAGRVGVAAERHRQRLPVGRAQRDMGETALEGGGADFRGEIGRRARRGQLQRFRAYEQRRGRAGDQAGAGAPAQGAERGVDRRQTVLHGARPRR